VIQIILHKQLLRHTLPMLSTQNPTGICDNTVATYRRKENLKNVRV